MKQEHFSKSEALAHWENLPENQAIALTPISTKHKGSTFACDGIRIVGSREYIDSVLANLKGFLEWESDTSRLEIKYTETRETIRDKETGKITVGELTGAWACYIRVKDRGRGTGKPRKEKMVEVTDDSPEPTKRIPPPTFPTKAPKEEPDYKGVNAGLAIRDKMRAAAKAKKLAVASAEDPLFAIGIADSEEDCGYTWTEPEDGDMPMTTYEDFVSCDSACTKLKKNSAFKKADLQIVEVWKDSKGKLHCNN